MRSWSICQWSILVLIHLVVGCGEVRRSNCQHRSTASGLSSRWKRRAWLRLAINCGECNGEFRVMRLMPASREGAAEWL